MSGTVLAHIILMSAMILLSIAAVAVALLKKGRFFRTHRFLTLGGIASGFAGVATMFVAKALNAWPHFNSNHSMGGLTAFILLTATAVGGPFARKLGRKGRIAHRIVGAIALLMALFAMAGGIGRL